jgi:hypothetical protein
VWLFPMGAGALSLIFSALVAYQWSRRRGPHQAAWAAALLMFALASFAAGMGMVAGWAPIWFRIYYLFGAIINVPFLALGTVYLLGPRPVGHVLALLLIAAAIFAAGAVFSTEVNSAALVVSGIPSAADVLGPDVLPRDLSRYYSFGGFFVVVAGALWSAWRLARGRDEQLRSLAVGNLLIAGGTIVVAAASGLARFGQGAVFAVGLLVGVSIMFAGFLKAGLGARPPQAEETVVGS